jgi:hypothetical protein
MITNGNSMKWYIIIREHDYKIMAHVKGYDFAVGLQDLYQKKFPQNKFQLQDKNFKQKHEKRK